MDEYRSKLKTISFNNFNFKITLPNNVRPKVWRGCKAMQKYPSMPIVGKALCVEKGFYADSSWESWCGIEINVWTHFYKIKMGINSVSNFINTSNLISDILTHSPSFSYVKIVFVFHIINLPIPLLSSTFVFL